MSRERAEGAEAQLRRQFEAARGEGADDSLAAAIEADDFEEVADLVARWPILAWSFHRLLQGVRLGRTRIVAALLAAGAPARNSDELGMTPLMMAAIEGHLDIARMLVEAGADPDALAEQVEPNVDWECRGRSAFYEAVKFGHADVAAFLAPLTHPWLRIRAELAVPDHPGPADEGLARAAAAGEVGAIRAALAAGADLCARTGAERQTALHAASSAGHAGAVAALLDAGAAVDARDGRGGTALWHAVRRGHAEVVDVLLARGADPDARDFDEECPPLIAAVLANDPDMTLRLLAHGADADATALDGLSAVDHAEYQDVERARAALFGFLGIS